MSAQVGGQRKNRMNQRWSITGKVVEWQVEKERGRERFRDEGQDMRIQRKGKQEGRLMRDQG